MRLGLRGRAKVRQVEAVQGVCPQAQPQTVSPGARLICNSCEHDWCGRCRAAWHAGLTCKEHARSTGEQAADQGFAEYKKENKARPRTRLCSHWHSKTGDG